MLGRCSFEDTSPTDDVYPLHAQVHLLFRRIGRWNKVVAGWPVATYFVLRSYFCFETAAFTSFSFTLPRWLAVWFPPHPQDWGYSRGVQHPPESWDPHKWRNGLRVRSYDACGRNAGRTFIAVGFLEPHTTTPTLVSRRFRWVSQYEQL